MNLCADLKLALARFIASASGPFGNHATLANNLVSYWALDEASGVRADAHSSNDLTDNNTVGSAAGMRNLAADFVAANSEWFSHTDSDNDFVIAAAVGMSGSLWAKYAAGPAYPVAQAHAATGGGTRGFEVLFTGGNAQAQWNGGTITRVAAAAAGSWHFVVWRATPAGGGQVTLALSLNGGAFSAESAAFTPNAASGGILQMSGYNGDVADANGRMQGQIDEVGIWARPLTQGEVDSLWNGGVGLFYGS